MCSLTYIPHEDGYILSHNRDEIPSRNSSSALETQESDGGRFYFPQDLKAGGTWMGAHEKGWSACLLNGGKNDYIRSLAYSQSRGKVIIDFLNDLNLKAFQAKSWHGIEPFSLIIAGPGVLWQLQHDPKKNYWLELNPKESHLFSSTKLYHPNLRRARKDRFHRWKNQQQGLDPQKVRNFHFNPQLGAKEGGLLLPPNFPLQTLSFCQIVAHPTKGSFDYNYLQKNLSDKRSWSK
jgi:hypothetical protein